MDRPRTHLYSPRAGRVICMALTALATLVTCAGAPLPASAAPTSTAPQRSAGARFEAGVGWSMMTTTVGTTAMETAATIADRPAGRGGSVIVIPSGPPPMPTTATLTPALQPDRLGARGALVFSVRYSGGSFGVPAPVRRSVLRLPAGLTLDIPSLRACPAARLRARGPGGCPAQSLLGSGEALLEVHAGTENIPEEARLWAFLGPPRQLNPTVEILAQGYTPLDERMVFSGSVLPAQPPYGEELAMSIPAVPTIEFEPDASLVRFALTIGARGPLGDSAPRARVTVPDRCPRGGFPFAGEFSYADGTTSSALAAVPCPRR